MRSGQKGVTFIGWLILLIPVAIVGYAAIRLIPSYLTYMKVSRSLNEIAKSFTDDTAVTPTALKNALDRRFDIESIYFPTTDLVTYTRDGTSWILEAKYEDEVPLFGNIALVAKFDKVATIK